MRVVCHTYRSAKVLIMSHYVGVIEPKTIYTTLCTPGQVSAVPSSARNGYPGTRVPVSIPVTRVPVRYPGTRVSLNTRVIFSQS